MATISTSNAVTVGNFIRDSNTHSIPANQTWMIFFYRPAGTPASPGDILINGSPLFGGTETSTTTYPLLMQAGETYRIAAGGSITYVVWVVSTSLSAL